MKGDGFEVKTPVVDIKSGEDAYFDLNFNSGISFEKCDYQHYGISLNDDDSIRLTLYDVIYPTRVTVSTQLGDNSILYDLNGGSFLDGRSATTFLDYYDISKHKRPNTQIGINQIYRDGYELIGWNTKADYSGTIIGLGSRVSTDALKTMLLFAQWKKETDISEFTYVTTDNSVTIKSYSGSDSELVIPAFIDDLPVTSVSRGAVKGFVGNLYLPCTMSAVEKFAFTDCQINEITFFDNITDISEMSFVGSSIPTWHINAILSPVYVGKSDNTQFAENIDHLMLSQGKNRLIIFGGCSVSYGLKSELIQEAYPDYEVLDCGVIGGTNAKIQFEIIKNFLHEGDIFIHAPEEGSLYQLMYSTSAEARMFMLVEGNYDLLSLVDMSSISNSFSVFTLFNRTRKEQEPSSYESYLTDYNGFGDICIERNNTPSDVSYSDYAYGYDLNYVTESSINGLIIEYNNIKEKGAKVYFSYGPVNYNGLTDEALSSRTWLSFAKKYQDALPQAGIPIISDVSNYLYLGRYFYDTDYHLNDNGAIKRTQNLIIDLKAVL